MQVTVSCSAATRRPAKTGVFYTRLADLYYPEKMFVAGASHVSRLVLYVDLLMIILRSNRTTGFLEREDMK